MKVRSEVIRQKIQMFTQYHFLFGEAIGFQKCGLHTSRALLKNLAEGGEKFSAWLPLCVQLRVSY